MNVRGLLRLIWERIYKYNLFTPDEDDYDDNNDEFKDPTTVIEHQRYATRLCIFLLLSVSRGKDYPRRAKKWV
jgi:hypothetical protein